MSVLGRFSVAPYNLSIKRLTETDCGFCSGGANHELANEAAGKSILICKGCVSILHSLLSSWLRMDHPVPETNRLT